MNFVHKLFVSFIIIATTYVYLQPEHFPKTCLVRQAGLGTNMRSEKSSNIQYHPEDFSV